MGKKEEACFLLLAPESSVSLDERGGALCVPLRALTGATRRPSAPTVDADGGMWEREERGGRGTEEGDGCEETGEVPEEEREWRLSGAGGTFLKLHICALRCFSTLFCSASLMRSHRLSNT